MPTWSFVRHGESIANAQQWFAGHSDAPLTERGRAQAEALREVLRPLALDRVLCSDLARARDTCAIAMAGRSLPTEHSDALRERNCGTWERRTLADLEHTGDLALLADFEGQPPGGESLRAVTRRVLTFLAAREVDHGHTLVVAHGAMMRGVLGTMEGLARDGTASWRLANCEVVSRELPRGRLAAILATL
ncbi:MAG: histidine phosphatase family protein [Deltaproteobacteria bacterium]|nr:histidine phosphatase family protein [Deltaproteobacteria bacterium]